MALFGKKKPKSLIADDLAARSRAEEQGKLNRQKEERKAAGSRRSRMGSFMEGQNDDDEIPATEEASLGDFTGGMEPLEELESMVLEDDYGSEKKEKGRERKSAKANNQEKDILDLFEVDNNLTRMREEQPIRVREEEESVEEEEPAVEEEPYYPDLNGESVIATLAGATDYYESLRVGDSVRVGVHYASDSVLSVTVSDGVMHLPVTKVYVGGVSQPWDDLFEVKIAEGAELEVETGVCLSVPDGYCLDVFISDSDKEKYAVDVVTSRISGRDAMSGILVQLCPANGAYLSRVGRSIACRLVEES